MNPTPGRIHGPERCRQLHDRFGTEGIIELALYEARLNLPADNAWLDAHLLECGLCLHHAILLKLFGTTEPDNWVSRETRERFAQLGSCRALIAQLPPRARARRCLLRVGTGQSLAQRLRLRLQRHVQGCPQCQADLAWLQQLDADDAAELLRRERPPSH